MSLWKRLRTLWAEREDPLPEGSPPPRFSKTVLRVLQKSGWHEGRQVDPAITAKWEEKLGQPLSDRAREIFTEFGGLEIGRGVSVDLTRLGRHALADAGLLSELAGFLVCPIGDTLSFVCDGLDVYVDDLGRIFVSGYDGTKAETDSRMDYAAANFDRALELMLVSRRPDPWPESSGTGRWHYNTRADEMKGIKSRRYF